jgi:hypothetical protein
LSIDDLFPLGRNKNVGRTVISISTSEEALGEFCSLLRKASSNGTTFGVPLVLDVFTYVREWDAGDKAQSFALFGVPKSMVTPAIDWAK